MHDYIILAENDTAEASPESILVAGIIRSALDGETALFDVMPGVGKSHGILKLAKETEMPISVFTNLRDNYDQFERWGNQEGIHVERLPTRDLCPTLRDENPAYVNDISAQEARAARDANWSPSVIHRKMDLPCQDGKNTCPYRERIRAIDTDKATLLVGHFTQAYNPTYVEDRAVVLDERCFDVFIEQIKNPIPKAEKFVSTFESFPFDEVRRPEAGEKSRRADALDILEEEGLDPADHDDSVGEFHAKAPLSAYAIYEAARMTNGLCVSEHNEKTAVFDDPHEGSLWLLDPPDLSNAEAVIALDATPCLSSWKRILGDDLEHYRLFDESQRNSYLSQQGYEFYQLNSYVWPVSGANVSINKCEAYLREIQREHGQCPDLITSKSLLEGLKEQGLDHLWRRDLHYGDLRGKNNLKESKLLVVLGSPGRSDTHFQYQAAFHGECAEPATDETGERLSSYNLDYQSDVANDELRSTRRGEVFQAAMRAGRSDAEATVYIATGMVPEWLSTKAVGQRGPSGTFDACRRVRDETERRVITTLQNTNGLAGSEIARRTNVASSTIRDALRRLQDEGLVEKKGARRGSTWHGEGLDDLNAAGTVDLTRASQPKSIDELALDTHDMGISSKTPLLNRRGERTAPFGYPPWMNEIRNRARKRRHTERLRRAY